MFCSLLCFFLCVSVCVPSSSVLPIEEDEGFDPEFLDMIQSTYIGTRNRRADAVEMAKVLS